MARKRQPNDLIDAFQTDLIASIDTWRAIRARVGVSGELAKSVSVDAFVRAAIAFEGFRSDWHIAAITRDSTAFAAYLTRQARNGVSKTPALQPLLRVELPKHPTLEQVADLLDPQRRNVSLSPAKTWMKASSEQLSDPWRATILSTRAADKRLTDAVIALRNYVAHESSSASDTANEALAALGPGDVVLRRGAHRISASGVGAYLNAALPDGTRRVERFHYRLHGIAGRLRIGP